MCNPIKLTLLVKSILLLSVKKYQTYIHDSRKVIFRVLISCVLNCKLYDVQSYTRRLCKWQVNYSWYQMRQDNKRDSRNNNKHETWHKDFLQNFLHPLPSKLNQGNHAGNNFLMLTFDDAIFDGQRHQLHTAWYMMFFCLVVSYVKQELHCIISSYP